MKQYSRTQAKAIKKFIVERLDTDLGWSEIADELNQSEFKPANGDSWTPEKASQFAYKRKIYMYKNRNRSKNSDAHYYPKPQIQSSIDGPMLRSLILDAKIDSDTKIRMLKNLENT